MPIGIASIRNAATRPFRVASTALISVNQWTSMRDPPFPGDKQMNNAVPAIDTLVNHQLRLAARPVGLAQPSDWQLDHAPVTAPAAPETTTVSPGLGWPTSIRPK